MHTTSMTGARRRDEAEAFIEECRRRDPKGLYVKADAGQIRNFTGVDAPYEAPLEPEIRLRTMNGTPEELADEVVAALRERGIIA